MASTFLRCSCPNHAKSAELIANSLSMPWCTACWQAWHYSSSSTLPVVRILQSSEDSANNHFRRSQFLGSLRWYLCICGHTRGVRFRDDYSRSTRNYFCTWYYILSLVKFLHTKLRHSKMDETRRKHGVTSGGTDKRGIYPRQLLISHYPNPIPHGTLPIPRFHTTRVPSHHESP